MSYRHRIRVEFGHCDPAGIVFYPRYFEMTNSVIEGLFRDHLGWCFGNIRADLGNGVPTVAINCEFRAPSRVGDLLDFEVSVARLGRSSVSFVLVGRCGEEPRIEVASTLVWLERGRPAAWPPALRDGLAALQDGPDLVGPSPSPSEEE